MLVISSAFIANPIKKSLEYFLEKFDFFKTYRIEFTSYNQVFQELENHHSITAQNIGGINVFVIKLDDFLRFQNNIVTQRDAINIIQREICRFTESLISRAQLMDSTSFVIMICHNTDTIVKKFVTYSDLVDNFKTKLTNIPNIHLILEQDIDQVLSIDNYYDPIADEKGHIPFTLGYYNALGYLLARKAFDITLLVHNPLKAVILDCDNTLWKGICGETGAETVEIPSSYRFLQHFMLTQKEKGVLLCLCSKNNEKDVLDVFNCNKNSMLLKLEDITAYKINWSPKSNNVRDLLGFLGFSEQNVAFIDDREDECYEIQKNFPNILTIRLPNETDIPSFLKNLWVFVNSHRKLTP